MKTKYKIIVIGAGHAGCEAALASSKMGVETLLLTLSVENIGLMSCNPAIGGLAKGNLVKDLDALGGIMGKAIDKSGIQFRVLNKKKGSAVQSSRSQADKELYREHMRRVVMSQPNLDVKQAIVTEVMAENDEALGVKTACGQTFFADKIIVTAGTFLDGEIYIGSFKMSAGRMYEPSAKELSNSLKCLGFAPIRHKTDTPARVDIRTVDISVLEKYSADEEIIPFSPETDAITLPQIDCYLSYTNEVTHRIIKDNLKYSMFYNGEIDGSGPRYCPSIEDKVIKFPDKAQHLVVIEPEGLNSYEAHVNGFSTSLPADIQLAAYRTLKGMENVEFVRPAYAIQYDIFQPTGLHHTYETKLIHGLYFAGQLNGTSGYEEAAVQGFMAGVNAALSVKGKEPFILARDESYIGVLTDDLVTKGVDEPYRVFTSRAEYRLLLREDNAERRLSEFGYKLGLISEERYQKSISDEKEISDEIERLSNTLITIVDLEKIGINANQPLKAADVLKRPEVSYCDIDGRLAGIQATRLEVRIKYQGYIDKQLAEVKGYKELELIDIPDNFDYRKVSGLRYEFIERLEHVRPKTLGQAMRVTGITATVIAVLNVCLADKNSMFHVKH